MDAINVELAKIGYHLVATDYFEQRVVYRIAPATDVHDQLPEDIAENKYPIYFNFKGEKNYPCFELVEDEWNDWFTYRTKFTLEYCDGAGDCIKLGSLKLMKREVNVEGAFNKIIAFAKLNKVDLTLSLAEEALKDVIYPNKPKEITPTLIINVVAEHFGVKPEDITSKKRNSEFVQPRQVVMYLCRELTDTSFTNIGKLLGKKDHTTIIHGVNKVAAEIQTNEELRNKIDIITKKINPS